MDNHVTYSQLIHTLRQSDEQYSEIASNDGARIVITQRGGRIFGPFMGDDSAESLNWISAALSSPDAFSDFRAAEQWNMGGDRVWIAPEIQYFIQDRNDLTGSYHLPPAVDPGQYTLTVASDHGIALEQNLTLEAHNLATGTKQLSVERFISAVADPLREIQFDRSGLSYFGYQQKVTLTELNTHPIRSESWVLNQLNPGGTLIIPFTHDVLAAEYFGSVADDAKTVNHAGGAKHLSIAITGDRQYKIGYKAVCMTGRFAYLNHLSDGRASVLVRQFSNNPSATYTEEPPVQPNENGFSVHVYNDGGALGGFGEMESNGQAMGGNTGLSTVTDTFLLWAYVGDVAAIHRVIALLLGVEL